MAICFQVSFEERRIVERWKLTAGQDLPGTSLGFFKAKPILQIDENLM
jgi:hypothetical protein